MSSNNALAGKRALITGVDRGGIGQGIAMELARQGAAVVCHYPYSDEGAAATVAQIQAAGGTAAAVQGDFTQSAAVCARSRGGRRQSPRRAECAGQQRRPDRNPPTRRYHTRPC